MVSRLEEIKNISNYTYDLLGIPHNKITSENLQWIINRVEELEKERSDWKGKHSILKRKYKSLKEKMNARWRYNRAIENESRSNKAVLEMFRGQNKRYKQALEEIVEAKENNYGWEYPEIVDAIATGALKEEDR